MISAETIREYAVRNQTTEENVVREYVQCLFLAYLYKQKGSELLLFKGGTALRLVYQSPRYSEDLDFTGTGVDTGRADSMIKKTLEGLGREGLDMEVAESKTTSGGYLLIIDGSAGEWRPRILVNISLRSGKAKGEAVLITNPLTPSYTIYILPEERLVREKIEALLHRKKPRDFFDLYFLLRKGTARKTIASQKNSLMCETRKIDNKKISTELKTFLPQSFWPTIRNLRENLLKELERI